MIYLIIFVSNYFSIGTGVWVAMRHGEISRRHEIHTAIGQTHLFGVPKPVSHDEEQKDVDVTQQISDDIIRDREEENLAASDRLRRDNGILSIAKPQFAGDMIEQLVGMAKDDVSKELASIVNQLQEIHDMAMGADNHFYASEDADSFITPDTEQYATTTFCRPVVGSKKEKTPPHLTAGT